MESRRPGAQRMAATAKRISTAKIPITSPRTTPSGTLARAGAAAGNNAQRRKPKDEDAADAKEEGRHGRTRSALSIAIHENTVSESGSLPEEIAKDAFDVVAQTLRLKLDAKERGEEYSEKFFSLQFERSIEGFNESLQRAPNSSECLCLCGKAFVLLAFANMEDYHANIEKANALFTAAVNGQGQHPALTYAEWGRSLSHLAREIDDKDMRSSLQTAAIEKFQKSYESLPDQTNWYSPVLSSEWGEELERQGKSEGWNFAPGKNA